MGGSRMIAGAAFAALASLWGVSPAGAQTPAKLTVSYSEKTVDNLPVQIAYDAGYFKKQGLDVSLLYVPAQQGVPALLTGQVQIASLGGSDAISAQAQGAKLVLVATLNSVLAFQFWTLPKFASASALKGQRVGVASTTGTLYAATLLALQQLGLKPSDVSITPLGSVPNVNSALLAGSVAAAASHPPATYEFKRAGLVDLVDLARTKHVAASAGIFATKAFREAHPELLQKAVNAVIEAINRAKSDRQFTEAEISKLLNVKDKAELDFTYDFYVKDILAAGPTPTVEQIKSNIETLSAGNPKVKSVDPAAMIDATFVKKAQGS